MQGHPIPARLLRQAEIYFHCTTAGDDMSPWTSELGRIRQAYTGGWIVAATHNCDRDGALSLQPVSFYEDYGARVRVAARPRLAIRQQHARLHARVSNVRDGKTPTAPTATQLLLIMIFDGGAENCSVVAWNQNRAHSIIWFICSPIWKGVAFHRCYTLTGKQRYMEEIVG